MISLPDSNILNYYPDRFDPRAKLFVWAFFFGTVILAPAEDTSSLFYLTFLIIFLFILANNFLGQMLKDVLRVYPMIFLITIHLPFHGSATKLATAEPTAFTINPAGLYSSITKLLHHNIKSVLLLCLSYTLVRTISHGKMIRLLHLWRFPDLVISILSYLRRLVRLILLETERVKMAARSRNLRLKGKGALKRLS